MLNLLLLKLTTEKREEYNKFSLGKLIKRMESRNIEYGDGWYPEENDGISSFRWMREEAKCLFSDIPEKGEKYLVIEGGHPFKGAENPVLTVYAEGRILGEREIFPGERKYLVPLDISLEVLEVDLKLNKAFDIGVTGDSRELGITVINMEIFIPEEEGLLYEVGWYDWEYDELFPFRWMSRMARVFLPSNKLKEIKYISFYIYSDFADFSQKLTLCLGKEIFCEIPLLHKWNYYSFPLRPLSPSLNERIESEIKGEKKANILRPISKNELALSLNKLFPKEYHEDDPRELGIRLSRMEFHNDDAAHNNFIFLHKNALLNYKEISEGKTKLDSYPLNLGIDLYGKCNIKPPCTYCPWDLMKEHEGEHVYTVVDEKTLENYGPFFRAARNLINCSIGEPLLHPRLEEILDFCQKNKKFMEISTNGQAFTERTIKALVGKSIFLYVSLDAASKETYAKIRNDRWDSIIPKLELLNQERKKHGNLPKIFMVFMPMKVNKDDLEDYFRLCQKIEADSLILRPLFYMENPQIEGYRGGYHFDYKKEFLSHEEIEEIFRKCDKFSDKYNISVGNQFNFGMTEEPGSKKKSRPSSEIPRF